LNKQVKTAAAHVPAQAPVPAASIQAASATPTPPVPAPDAATSSASAKPATVSAPAAEDPLAESKSDEAALNQFKAANYAGSIAGFKNFLKSYPGSSLASNAQYWIGYSYYALKDYKSALSQQQKLIGSYPQSAKVPDALLNMASSQLETDDTGAARKTLEEIVNKHPGTNAAKIAAKRLAALK
jgi:tol-pal system protein YbgF